MMTMFFSRLTLIADEARESGTANAPAVDRVACASSGTDAVTGAVLAEGSAGTNIAAGAADPTGRTGAGTSHSIAGSTDERY